MAEELKYDARDVYLSDILFTSHKKFKVPRYQRPYTWTEDQLSDFWGDLNDEHPTFFGSFIFNTESKAKTGYYEIIDGQQRLLTITIFLAVLRDIAKSIDTKRSSLFQRHDISIEDSKGTATFRIICGETLKTFFEKNIQHDDANIDDTTPKTKEEKLIKGNYKWLREQVGGHLKSIADNSKKLDHLQKLRDKVYALPVIQIEIGSEDNAYDIFEATNARGLDLSVADLLKNMIFNKLRNTEEKDIAKEYWNEIVDNVQETNTELKKFIRYFWISRHGLVSEKRLYKTIKNSTSDYEDLLGQLHSDAALYNKFLAGDKSSWEDIKSGNHIYKTLQALLLMNVTQCYVLFLAIMRNYDKLGTDPKRVFKWIEHFSFVYSAICKLPGNKLEKLYSSYAKDIEQVVRKHEHTVKNIPKEIQSLFEKLKVQLKEQLPGFEQFKEAFSEVSFRQTEKLRMLTKYILAKLNSIEQESEFEYSAISIEHVLPQTPNKDWGLKKKDIRDYVNRLGNLTMLHTKINSAAGNKIISEKIGEYKKSGVRMTLDLVKRLEELKFNWNKEEIDKRHDELAELAYYKAWVIE